jgi:hypothetical protein
MRLPREFDAGLSLNRSFRLNHRVKLAVKSEDVQRSQARRRQELLGAARTDVVPMPKEQPSVVSGRPLSKSE